MSVGAAPQLGLVDLAEINGRLQEARHQIAEASARCVVLAGEKAKMVDLLKAQDQEIKRLSAEVERLTPAPAADPAPGAAPTVQ